MPKRTGTVPALNNPLHLISAQISPEALMGSMNGFARAGCELIFYPNHNGESARSLDEGVVHFQGGFGKVLFSFGCNFAQYLKVVETFGFQAYEDDKLAFHYPRP
jgi:hypothetical protein